MERTIKLKRGQSAGLGALALAEGEPAFTLDTNKLYIFNGDELVLINPDILNVETADKLKTGRKIELTGDATGNVTFDGSKDETLTLILTNSGGAAGTYTKVTVNSKGIITSATTLTAEDIPNLTLSKITDAGTAASKNTGTAAGNIPILDGGGKLNETILPAFVREGYDKAYEAELIAKGKSRALVFTTLQELNNWISGIFTRPDGKTIADLQVGDNLYIIDRGVPDYWWDGTGKQELETEKVDLTDYPKTAQVQSMITSYIETMMTEVNGKLDSKEDAITPSTASTYLNGLKTFADFATSVRQAALTGLSLSDSTAITAADNMLTATGKLQAQINQLASINIIDGGTF